MAISCCEKAIQINPNYADAHSNLGATLKELGEYQKAISCCEKAIQIQPNLEQAHINLGLVFQELGEIRKAINCQQKLSQIQSNPRKCTSESWEIIYSIRRNPKSNQFLSRCIKI